MDLFNEFLSTIFPVFSLYSIARHANRVQASSALPSKQTIFHDGWKPEQLAKATEGAELRINSSRAEPLILWSRTRKGVTSSGRRKISLRNHGWRVRENEISQGFDTSMSYTCSIAIEGSRAIAAGAGDFSKETFPRAKTVKMYERLQRRSRKTITIPVCSPLCRKFSVIPASHPSRILMLRFKSVSKRKEEANEMEKTASGSRLAFELVRDKSVPR